MKNLSYICETKLKRTEYKIQNTVDKTSKEYKEYFKKQYSPVDSLNINYDEDTNILFIENTLNDTITIYNRDISIYDYYPNIKEIEFLNDATIVGGHLNDKIFPKTISFINELDFVDNVSNPNDIENIVFTSKNTEGKLRIHHNQKIKNCSLININKVYNGDLISAKDETGFSMENVNAPDLTEINFYGQDSLKVDWTDIYNLVDWQKFEEPNDWANRKKITLSHPKFWQLEKYLMDPIKYYKRKADFPLKSNISSFIDKRFKKCSIPNLKNILISTSAFRVKINVEENTCYMYNRRFFK